MSGEQISATNSKTESEYSNKKKYNKEKVDINVLLNRVRSENRKEKFENFIFIGLIGIVILVTGIIASL